MAEKETPNPENTPHLDTMVTMPSSNVHNQPTQKDELTPHDHERAAAEEKEAWIVKFEEVDTENPKNFKTWYKIFLTFQMSMLAFAGSLGSSIVSPGQSDIGDDFHVSDEVASLTLSLFVLGTSCLLLYTCQPTNILIQAGPSDPCSGPPLAKPTAAKWPCSPLSSCTASSALAAQRAEISLVCWSLDLLLAYSPLRLSVTCPPPSATFSRPGRAGRR